MQQMPNDILQLFVSLQRFKTVAEHLNAEGHRTKSGALFTGQTVSRILRDKKYVEDGTVSQELWEQVQEIIEANKRGGTTRRVAHLCAGLLQCGCGQTMYVPTNSKKYVCAKCLNKLGKDDAEAIVVEKLKADGSPDVQEAVALWPTLSFEQKRELVESTVESIVCDGKRVSISLYAFS